MSNEIKARTQTGSWVSLKASKNGELHTSSIGRLITENWNDFEVITKNLSGDPTQVVYRLDAEVVATINITYDVDGDLQRVQKV